MMTPFHVPVLLPVALAAVTLGFAQDEFLARDAEADAALEAVADYCTHAKLWEKASVQVLADLNMRAYEAEDRRRHARKKLLWEWCEAIKALAREEDAA